MRGEIGGQTVGVLGLGRPGIRRGPEFAAALREHAVLVRHFNKPRTAPYLRITVGTEDDVRRLIAAAVIILGHE